MFSVVVNPSAVRALDTTVLSVEEEPDEDTLDSAVEGELIHLGPEFDFE